LGAALPQCQAQEKIEARVNKGEASEGVMKLDLPTPALLLDLDIFERNVANMAAYASQHGKALRPHAKTHKCTEIAKRQIQAGAVGVCVATVPEARVMARAGINEVLLASPIASPSKATQLAELARNGCAIIVAVDHLQQVEMYERAAAELGVSLGVLVDLDVGDKRTGAMPGEDAVKLADQVMRSKHLTLRGLQAYSGGSSHVPGFAERKNHSHQALAAAVATRERFHRSGLPADILSGTSTGTYNIDSELEGMTEMQAGSYVAMDVDYRRIGGQSGELYDDFGPALTVLATVVSANHRGQATIDAGFKAFATDRPFGPETKNLAGVSYRFRGDEFGILSWDGNDPPVQLGDQVELITPHCDPTVNLYDRIYACRGDKVEGIWSVMERLRTPAGGDPA
jgi:D-serine deaminase-like pyridoxal phosphate-dependent protein